MSAVSGSGAVNWDAGDNGDPGLTLSPDPGGLVEISAPHVGAWRTTATDDIVLSGRGSLRLFVAVAGFDTDRFGGMLGGLVTCTAGITGCTTIGQGSAVFSQASFGADFGELWIDLGQIDHTVPAGNSLVVTVAVPGSMTSDMWIAFGSSSHPSAFRLI